MVPLSQSGSPLHRHSPWLTVFTGSLLLARLRTSFVPFACVFAAMSRGDDLRQLAAQLTMLATLEDSIVLGISTVMGTAGSGGSAAPTAAGSPAATTAATASSAASSTPLRNLSSHVAATALLRAATTTSASSRARSRSRSPVPQPKRAPRRSSSTATSVRGSAATSAHSSWHAGSPAPHMEQAMAPPASVSRTPRFLGSPVLGGSGLVTGLSSAAHQSPPVSSASLASLVHST